MDNAYKCFNKTCPICIQNLYFMGSKLDIEIWGSPKDHEMVALLGIILVKTSLLPVKNIFTVN